MYISNGLGNDLGNGLGGIKDCCIPSIHYIV